MSDAEEATPHFDSMQILQSLPDAVFVVDSRGGVVVWNRMAEQISGYSADELLGRKCPDDVLQNVTPYAQEKAGGGADDDLPREIVTYMRHHDGHLVPVLVKLSPVMQDGKVIATIAQFSDMTPRALQEPHTSTTPDTGEWVDAVTLLPSMLASTAQMRDAFERWKLTGERFSAILIAAADTHTIQHQHGATTMERLFSALGKTLSGALRHNDFVGRWMEEQFIALLPQCAQPQAREAGRRLLTLLQQTAVCHDGEYVNSRVYVACTSVRANDTPAKLLERLYQELKRKEHLDQLTSTRSSVPFHQQRPM